MEQAAATLLEGVDWIDAPALVAEAVAVECGSSSADAEVETTFYLSDKTTSLMELATKTFRIKAQWNTKVLD